MALRQMESTKVKVGQNDFHIKPFPAFKAANLAGELASVLSPIIGAIAPLANDGNLMDVDVTKAADVLSTTSLVSGDKLESLLKKLLLSDNIVIEYENEDGDKEQDTLNRDLADEVFCGNVQDMFVLAFHVIKLNFNGFFEKLVTPSGKAEQVATKTRKIL